MVCSATTVAYIVPYHEAIRFCKRLLSLGRSHEDFGLTICQQNGEKSFPAKVLFLSRIIPRRKKIIAATMFLHSNFTVYLVEEELELLIG